MFEIFEHAWRQMLEPRWIADFDLAKPIGTAYGYKVGGALRMRASDGKEG
jgi:hypothetical protein